MGIIAGKDCIEKPDVSFWGLLCYMPLFSAPLSYKHGHQISKSKQRGDN